jgi:hypothetical protein
MLLWVSGEGGRVQNFIMQFSVFSTQEPGKFLEKENHQKTGFEEKNKFFICVLSLEHSPCGYE